VSLQFRLFSAATGGSPIVSRQLNNRSLTSGLINAEVEFGQDVFANAADLWLEVSVQNPAGSGAFVPLTPRQRLSSSIFAMNTRGVRVDAQGRVGLGPATGQPLPATLNLRTVADDPRVLAVTTTAGFERWAMTFGNSGELGFRSTATGGNTFVLESDGDAAFNAPAAVNPSAFNKAVSITGGTGGSFPGSAAFVVSNPVVGSTWSMGVLGNGGFSFIKNGAGPNTVAVPVLQITGGSDIAEPYDVAPARDAKGEIKPVPGMVVSIDPDRVGKMRVADRPYDRRVAGIISGANGVAAGLTLAQSGTCADGEFPIAKVGRVWVLADATDSPIEPGDLLTTAELPGHAMRADPSRAAGCAIGKAMSRLDSGKGYVLLLVNLQ
jgi:hypothetical protein